MKAFDLGEHAQSVLHKFVVMSVLTFGAVCLVSMIKHFTRTSLKKLSWYVKEWWAKDKTPYTRKKREEKKRNEKKRKKNK